MEVRDAVKTARQYLENVFGDEDTSHSRLEEVDYEAARSAWKITFSFLRPTGTLSNKDMLLPSLSRGENVSRDYKVVTVDDLSEKATSVKHRTV